jgi:hypothetical protein
MYGSYGFTENYTIKNSNILNIPNYSLVFGQNNVITLGSGGASFTDPILTLDLTVAANKYFIAQAFVGQKIAVVTNSGGYFAPTGNFGIVTAVTGSLNSASVTVQFSDVLAGTESLGIIQEPFNANFEGVTANGVFVNQSYCTYSSSKASFRFSPATSAEYKLLWTLGTITKLTINVLRPYTGSTAGNVDVNVFSYYPYYTSKLNELVDLKTAGKRESTLYGYVGWTGTGGESSGAVLPNGRFSAIYPGSIGIQFPTVASAYPTQLAEVLIEIEFDSPTKYLSSIVNYS